MLVLKTYGRLEIDGKIVIVLRGMESYKRIIPYIRKGGRTMDMGSVPLFVVVIVLAALFLLFTGYKLRLNEKARLKEIESKKSKLVKRMSSSLLRDKNNNRHFEKAFNEV